MNSELKKAMKKRGLKSVSSKNQYLQCPKCHSRDLGIISQTPSSRTILCDCGHKWKTRSSRLVR